MVELGNIKIRKKAYRFQVSKRYQSERHFRKKERPPIEMIKGTLKNLLKPKKEKKKIEEKPPATGFNLTVIAGTVIIALIIIGIAWIYASAQIFNIGKVQPIQAEKPTIDNRILGTQVLTAGARGTDQHVAAVMIDYTTKNINNYTINITTYNQRIPSQVFVLDSNRFEATTYPDFVRLLRLNLAKRKIKLNEININELETITDPATIIIPSGVIPKEMLGYDSTISIDKLASKGIVVIYIGQSFTKMLNGSLVGATPNEKIQTLPFGFDENSVPATTNETGIFQPLYKTLSRADWKSGMVYGSISSVTKGDGAFIFIPQTLDGGWRGNYTSAATDISKIIFETPWATPNNQESRVYTFANSTDYTGTRYFFSNPFTGNSSTVKIEFIGYSPTSNYPIRETLVTYAQKSINGELYVENGYKIVPTNITNSLARLNAKLQEAVPAQPDMRLVMTDNSGNFVQELPQGSVNVQAEKSFDVPIYLDKGEYIVGLLDDNNKVYAQTYLKVVSIEILFKGVSVQKRSVYVFDAVMDENPV
ncbi:hypothetical protein HZC07_03570, partial [Candidatus Micrarchaeota archaeon]|nr:hypothetical protein [Candidatus Micrarchaeota archaeon]